MSAPMTCPISAQLLQLSSKARVSIPSEEVMHVQWGVNGKDAADIEMLSNMYTCL